MANTNGLPGARPANPNAKIRWLPIAASQTLARGDFVLLSSGLVQIALAASTELCGVIAADQATPTASTLVPVYADPDEEFIVIADADSSAIVAGNYRDIIGATGAMKLDADATSTNVLTVLRADPDDTLTDANARWLVKIALHAFADVSS